MGQQRHGPEKRFPRMVQAHITDETYEWIDGLATTLGWSLSATVRLLIDDHIRWMEEAMREHVSQSMQHFEKETSSE